MLIPRTKRAGGLAVFIIITHNGARPNEMNSKNPSLPPTRRARPDGTEEAIAGGLRWMVHTAVSPGADRLGRITGGATETRSAFISHADAACVSATCNITAQFLPVLGPQKMRFALRETVN